MARSALAAPSAPEEPEEGERRRDITVEPTVGGSFDENGACLQAGGIPEPDEHRMTKPER